MLDATTFRRRRQHGLRLRHHRILAGRYCLTAGGRHGFTGFKVASRPSGVLDDRQRCSTGFQHRVSRLEHGGRAVSIASKASSSVLAVG